MLDAILAPERGEECACTINTNERIFRAVLTILLTLT